VHNGADDNASGVAVVIELARRLAPEAHRLRRSILFITFSGEERGLLGSKRFAEAPLLEPFGSSAPLKPVAMVNLDMVGRMKDQKVMISGLATSDDWPALMARVQERWKAEQGPPLSISADKAEEIFGSSDHLSFYQMHLPVLFFFTGAHKEYHTPDDDLYRQSADGRRELLINVEGANEVLGFVGETVREISVVDSPPRYKAGIELSPRMSFKVVLRLLPDYGAEVEGMRIAQVTPDGPAARAGLKSGDVIVRFGSTPVRSVRDYMVGLEQARPGEEIEIAYLRDGKTLTARLVPASFGQ
jgi:membrane-associated protease RseP (regulator of RpoE activity)